MKNIDVLVSSVLCCHFVASDGRAFEPREIFFGECRRTFQTKLNGSFKQLNIKKSNLLFGTLASPFFLKKKKKTYVQIKHGYLCGYFLFNS